MCRCSFAFSGRGFHARCKGGRIIERGVIGKQLNLFKVQIEKAFLDQELRTGMRLTNNTPLFITMFLIEVEILCLSSQLVLTAIDMVCICADLVAVLGMAMNIT